MELNTKLAFGLTLILCLALPQVTLAANETTACHLGGGSEATECDTATTFLQCHTVGGVDMCQCDSNSFWQTGKCVLKLFESCVPSAQPCMAFTACGGTPGAERCQCRAGTTPVGGQCRADITSPCDPNGVNNPTCNDASYLVCEKVFKTCQCRPGTNLIDDGTTKQCKADLNAPCSSPASPAAPDCDDSPSKFFQCKFGRCGCQEDSVPVLVATSKYECQAAFGTACNTADGLTPAICDTSSFLECNTTNICSCQADHVGTVDKCFAYFNEPCGGHDVMCDTSKWLTCKHDALLQPKCLCTDGHEGEAGKCQANFGDDCKADPSLCDGTKFLTCGATSGKCECQSDTRLVNGMCLSTLGTACNTTDGRTPLCDDTSFLECNAGNLCSCNSDHTQENGKCIAKITEECSGQDVLCDVIAHLSCQDNECKCNENLGVINDGNGTCIAKPGGICAGSLTCEANYAACVDNAICACNEGLADNGFGLCRVKINNTCDATHPCDALANCTESATCQCVGDLMDNGNGVCRVKPNGACDVNKPCAGLAECLEGKCRCPAGTGHDGLGSCKVVDLDRLCSPKFDCDASRYLTCGLSLRCECSGSHVAKDGRCVPNLGEACDLTDRFCDGDKMMLCQGGKCICQVGLSEDGGVCSGVGKLALNFNCIFALFVVIWATLKL